MDAGGNPTRKKPASADAGAVLVLWPQFIAGRVRHNRAWLDRLDTSEGEIALYAALVKAIVDEVEATKITSERTAKRLQRRLAVADQHRDMVARLQQSLPIVRERDRLSAERIAQAKAKAHRDAERTKESTRTKREKAAGHFSVKWLAEAHKKNPTRGAERLALDASRLVPRDHPDYDHRAKITEHRAKQYLRSIRNPGDM